LPLWQLSCLKKMFLSSRLKKPRSSLLNTLWMVFTQTWRKQSHLSGSYFPFSFTFGFPTHCSAAKPCMYAESIEPSILRCEFNV
jgi:hypothetical protein